MDAQLIKLFQQEPWLLYTFVIIIVLVLITVVAFAINSIGKGLDFKFFGFQISKPQRKNSIQISELSIPPIVQSPTINVNIPPPHELSVDEITRIAAVVERMQTTTDSSLIKRYLSPICGPKASYLFSIPLDIRERLAKIVVGIGGHWAGCSIAPLETYLGYGSKYLEKDLVQKIEDLMKLISFQTYHEDQISDDDLLKIQLLNADINMGLEKAFKRLDEDGKINHMFLA